MGWTVLYIAFGIVALWLLGEVLLQYKARLRWRVLAFTGFLGVVAGALIPSVIVIGVGIAAFATGQTFVTLSYRRGFAAGWALNGLPGTNFRRRDDEADGPEPEPAAAPPRNELGGPEQAALPGPGSDAFQPSGMGMGMGAFGADSMENTGALSMSRYDASPMETTGGLRANRYDSDSLESTAAMSMSGFGGDDYGSNRYDGNGQINGNGYEANGYETNGFEANGFDTSGFQANGFDGGAGANGFETQSFPAADTFATNGYERQGYETVSYDTGQFQAVNGYGQQLGGEEPVPVYQPGPMPDETGEFTLGGYGYPSPEQPGMYPGQGQEAPQQQYAAYADPYYGYDANGGYSGVQFDGYGYPGPEQQQDYGAQQPPQQSPYGYGADGFATDGYGLSYGGGATYTEQSYFPQAPTGGGGVWVPQQRDPNEPMEPEPQQSYPYDPNGYGTGGNGYYY